MHFQVYFQKSVCVCMFVGGGGGGTVKGLNFFFFSGIQTFLFIECSY